MSERVGTAEVMDIIPETTKSPGIRRRAAVRRA